MGELVIAETPGAAADLAAMLVAAGLPSDDLTEPGRRFFRFSDAGETVGFIGWEAAAGSGHALLRSLVVAPARRGRGDGTRMIRWALARLAQLGFADAWVLTTSIADLAVRLGFTIADRAAAPAEIRASRQFAQLCPASAVLLHKSLP